jgi:hypothetical protein
MFLLENNMKFKIIFWVVAFIFSSFYGVRAYYVDGFHKMEFKTFNFIYAFNFHFLGSMIFGWSYAYVLIKYSNIESNGLIGLFCLKNFIHLFVVYIGVSGHFPQATYGVVKTFNKIIESILSKSK